MNHTAKNILSIIGTQLIIHLIPTFLWINYLTKTHNGDGDLVMCSLAQLMFLWVSLLVMSDMIMEYKERGSLVDSNHPKYKEWLNANQ